MKLFTRLLSWLAPFAWQIVLATLLGCIMIASNVALLSMAAYLIAAAAITSLLMLLTVPIAIVRFVGVVRPFSRYAERLVSHHITFRLLARLRVWVYTRLEPLAPAHLLRYRSGDILTRLLADIDELQNIYLRILSPLIVASMICLLTFALFSLFSLLLAWVALAFLLIAGVSGPLLAWFLSRKLGKQQLTLRALQKAQLVDGIQGIQDILAYGQSTAYEQNIRAVDAALGRVQARLAQISGLQEALNDFLMNLALWVILVLAIPLVASGAINAVYLGFLGLLILASFEALQPLAQAFQFLGHSLAAGKRLFEIADAEPPVVETKEPLPIEDAPTGYCLEVEHVEFSYSHNDKDVVLDDICLRLQPGQRVAIVGPSGAGKSTLVSLLLRFWDPTHGLIRLNGKDIRTYALEDLRALIGVVMQDTYLWHHTLRSNLLLARSGASDSELMQVLEQAQLREFVNQLPQGLDTLIGEQGLRLSGGERQRLAVARALLKNAPILILDEVTANLDYLTEQKLLDALDMLMRERTTLLITHRLRAMERMDEILVFDSGHIKERGTHSQLLAANGLYRRMFELQNGILTFSEV
ncbi:thiol reductant ABC exporter subunit CydC [Ktedonosporobacter rubrisoli]|uniref:Thiol reductant ABC exporter subunit CydC n=1 Tax=Ktedonosporobacter rubrisoli TaxID=2509675 RepID=A0A4P6JSU2_KTERU|nr:thiol reductant ABC exporter subunit CydC [Ktedonosporobacter rubrisoli]QBD77946.1 thiol reductant ABC exporter subunit CydC [Ktedonosporobacter rubrisoli]